MLNDLYHMLDPVAISAGPITIYWYGLAYVVGALLTAGDVLRIDVTPKCAAASERPAAAFVCREQGDRYAQRPLPYA